MPKTVGVLLSGCGVLDGSEIFESVLTLLALDRAGATVVAMAPNVMQREVVNHVKRQAASGEQRNVLVEASRIVRGQIKDVADVRALQLDALILPGGYGAAKNLSDYAFKGAAMSVHPEVERIVREMNEAGKPLGFVCIAPVIAAKLLGSRKVRLTIGNDAGTARDIATFGGQHVECPVTECVVDKALKVVTTPAYMYPARISEAAAGIDRLVAEVLAMA